ncbi:hypothetical protein HHE06_15910 [Helicobacter heilmannii]|nr:hypothetical protein HHE06_15910 [Helicobacter heilmannii]
MESVSNIKSQGTMVFVLVKDRWWWIVGNSLYFKPRLKTIAF